MYSINQINRLLEKDSLEGFTTLFLSLSVVVSLYCLCVCLSVCVSFNVSLCLSVSLCQRRRSRRSTVDTMSTDIEGLIPSCDLKAFKHFHYRLQYCNLSLTP